MRTNLIIAGMVVAATMTACSSETAEAGDPAVAICQELSGSWEALQADESSATARRIGEALSASENPKLRTAGASYLEFSEYPRNPDGTVTLDAAREHLVDRLVAIKTVGAGCSEIGVELSQEMREAAEAAEEMDGIPTDEEEAANDPVVVAIGETALMEGDEGAVEVTVADPEEHAAAPDGEEPTEDVFLVVHVTIVGVEGSYLYSSLTGFSLEAADGTVYYTAYVPAFGPEVAGGSVGPGETLTGIVVFDLPSDAIEDGKILLEGFGMDFTSLPGAIWTL